MKRPWPILWFDLDNRLHEMAPAEKWIAAGRVIPWTFNDPLIEGSIRARQASVEIRGSFRTIGAPKTQPKGYLNILDRLEEAKDFVVQNDIRTVVFDPMTRAIEHMERFLQYQTKHGVIEESAWGIYKSNLEELMNHVMSIPCNKVFVFHSREYFDEDTGRRTKIKPLVSGQMQDKVGSYFAEAWYTFVEHTNEGPIWRVRTKPAPWVDCRTSKSLDEVETADFAAILEKGGWSDKPFTVMFFGPFGSGKTSLALSLCEVEEAKCSDARPQAVESPGKTSTTS